MSAFARSMFKSGCSILKSQPGLRPGCRGLTVVSRSLSIQRGFTRSMWNMCNNKTNPEILTTVRGSWPRLCGCCGLHTEGDKEISEFLTEEIKLEKTNEKTPGQLPEIKGFQVKSKDGPNLVLERKTEHETISIKFNVNHTVEDTNPMDFKEGDSPPEGSGQMVSRPPFTVEITKAGGDKTLAIQCVFPMDDTPPEEGEEQGYVDMIEIQDIALLKANETWDDKVYTLSGQVMDGNLYDMLLNTMEERGVDADFVDEMVHLSTAYEHTTYISFLEQLKDFAGK